MLALNAGLIKQPNTMELVMVVKEQSFLKLIIIVF
jgi:hypothetical protein